jgi:hypothetical protein
MSKQLRCRSSHGKVYVVLFFNIERACMEHVPFIIVEDGTCYEDKHRPHKTLCVRRFVLERLLRLGFFAPRNAVFGYFPLQKGVHIGIKHPEGTAEIRGFFSNTHRNASMLYVRTRGGRSSLVPMNICEIITVTPFPITMFPDFFA